MQQDSQLDTEMQGDIDADAPGPLHELDENGMLFYYWIVRMKRDQNTLQEFDSALATQVADRWSEVMDMRDELHNMNSYAVSGQKGEPKLHPLKRELRQVRNKISSDLSKLGLTTTSRNNIPTEGLNGNDDDDEEPPAIKQALNQDN